MQNLTENQKQLIQELTNEFISINLEKTKKKKGNLFDIDGLLQQKNLDLELRNEIELKNKIIREKLFEIVENDTNKLNEDLKELGLIAFQPKNWHKGYDIVINTIEKYNRYEGRSIDKSIRISYSIPGKTKRFESKIGSIDELINEYTIEHGYGSNPPKYTSIENLVKDQYFMSNLKELINEVN